MSNKVKGKSITQKLLNLSAKQGTSFANLVTTFLIERLVARFASQEKLQMALVFKGGFVGLKVYNSPRYTIDLDALLLKANLEETLKLTKAAAEIDLDDGVWFRFESQIDLATQGEYGGIRQIFRTGIGDVLKNLKKAQMVNFDLGIGDPVTPKPFKTKTQSLLGTGEELSWSVYPIETIIAEKLHALVARGNANSRSKDIHDLAIFMPKAEKVVLNTALKKCFDYRKTHLPKSFSQMLKNLDTTILEKGWASATVSIPNAAKFKTTFDQLVLMLEEFDTK